MDGNFDPKMLKGIEAMMEDKIPMPFYNDKTLLC